MPICTVWWGVRPQSLPGVAAGEARLTATHRRSHREHVKTSLVRSITDLAAIAGTRARYEVMMTSAVEELLQEAVRVLVAAKLRARLHHEHTRE